ncbi:hypothetical protein JTB14_009492 [Gonioctena quinquepunctata]|nr:hypothetical protein JTB14_009492 [Gonioctena quinquepunctata]
MLSFPPHCSHRMQTLDICLYGPFKSRCKTSFNDYIVGNPGKAITINDIAKLTSQPYLLSFTPHNITKSFEKTGIWPINSLVFNDDEFAGVLSYGPEGISEPSSSTQSDNHKTCEPSTSKQPDDNTCEPIASTSKSDFVLENTVMTELNCRSSINESSKNNTLDSIRPFPVLQPKTDNKRERKKGKSCIFTSTPEMKRIQEEENIKQAKRRVQELKRAITVKRQLVKKTNALGVTTKKTPKKKQTYSSSLTEYGDVNELLDDECIEVEDFVLVKFPAKKKVVYYMGIIEEISGNELTVHFLRFKENCGFYYPVTKDISLIGREDIVAKLPPPTQIKAPQDNHHT